MTALRETFENRERNGLAALLWCLPALLGFSLMCLVMPFLARVPFWPALMLADVFFLWFS